MKTKRLRRYQHWMRRTGCKWYMLKKDGAWETWKPFISPAAIAMISKIRVGRYTDEFGRVHHTISGPGFRRKAS